jgi:uncharacterized protein (TIGR02117 family)
MCRAVLKRVWLYGLYGIMSTIALLAIAAFTPRQWHPLTQQPDCKFRVYVSGDAMHTNLFVPVRNEAFDWSQHLDLATLGKRAPATYRYLQFGWGDRVFYVETASWDKISLSSALRSLLLQNPAALFVKGHTAVPQYPGETLKCVSLNQANYLKLMDFLEASFQTNSQGQERISSGQDGDSSFYAATGRYSMLKTCNSWTADGLRSAGVNTPLWGALALAVMHQLKDSCECGK